MKILIELSHRNYNKRVYPTPIETLITLFSSLKLNYTISFKIRSKLLERLLKNKSETTWQILERLLKDKNRILNSKSSDVSKELNDYYDDLENYLLTYCESDSEKWCFILEYYISCKYEFKTRILAQFNSIKDSLNDKNLVWNKIRTILGRYHDHHYDKKYFKRDIEPLKKLYDELTPTDSLETIRWAFDESLPSTPSGKYKNPKNLQKTRKDMIEKIYSKQGFEGIYSLINTVNEPHIISQYCLDYDIDSEIIKLLDKNDCCRSFSKNYIYSKAKKEPEWIGSFILKIKDDKKINIILPMLPCIKETWEVVERQNSYIKDIYWITNTNTYYGKEISELKYYISKLLKYNKIEDVIKAVCYNLKILEIEYIGNTLTKIDDEEELLESVDYELQSILNYLHENDYNKYKLITLELKFASCFRFETIRSPLCIHEEFSINPKIFCEVIEKRFEITNKYDYPYFNILDSWRKIPGINKKNKINKYFLFDWYNKCKELLNTHDMEYVDIKIGLLLGRFEKNENNWPCEEVCDIIEEFNNDKINLGFKRGLSSINYYKSGVKYNSSTIERKIAKDYEEFYNKYQDIYPLITKLMLELKTQRLTDAKRIEIIEKQHNFRY